MSLALRRVSFGYPGSPPILEDASYEFESGGYYLLRGPSGAGKSTLLRLLCRLEEAQEGAVLFEDRPITDLAPPELRRNVAYVQQMPNLLPGTVRDNLLLPFSFAANAALPRPSDADLAGRLDRFLLAAVTPDSQADKLSVGQAQRVCLIRSLLLSPKVLLLDEPTASLDAKSADVVLDKARELAGDGMTVIMISHSEAVPPGLTRILSIENRRLVDQ
ncbi:ABC transporter ATP-binding protein [Pseudodesulfovibrio indicus]|uniref:ABC transport system ATP-binding protein n=1 Tax=Pseudodesulfovibrio indicus TaxID=1716143 RepID=A0A140D945_9BACT|nr:ATP-binding cassette domain-containing protein [Pseudodesulfovibrio indicus]AMK09712.1 ABC transporter [Pseudodesulfovibrio indicus]TDT86329.1 putative ABC transport system ATP-binding protein [Pseudodesulfovibrio indicus]